jgi:hypothetical protein
VKFYKEKHEKAKETLPQFLHQLHTVFSRYQEVSCINEIPKLDNIMIQGLDVWNCISPPPICSVEALPLKITEMDIWRLAFKEIVKVKIK